MTLPNPLPIITGPPVSDDEPLPGAAPHPEPVTEAGNATGPVARNWLAAVTGSTHLGGGSHGLAAFLVHPRPEPLKTHLRHAGNAIDAARDPENANRGAEAMKAAYHLLVAIPLKLLAKTIRRGADILDCAPDAPHILILAVVITGIIAAVFLLG